MNTRLSSFLSMNSFLIGFSVLILGGMLSAASRMSVDAKLLALLALGTLVHSILAYIGYDAARLTRSSIQAATDSSRYCGKREMHGLPPPSRMATSRI